MKAMFSPSWRPTMLACLLTRSFQAILTGLALGAFPAPLPAGDADGRSGPLDGFPAAYAIKDARIVAAPGKTFDPGVIVVRRGVIEAVGVSKDITVPFDAEVIDGKGLTVYPGFIDLFTTVGQRSGADRSGTGRGRPVDLAESSLAATPADNRKGLTPEFESAAALELTEAVVEPHRRLGFTDLLSAPAARSPRARVPS